MKNPRFFVFFDKQEALKDYSRPNPLKIWEKASPFLSKRKKIPKEINLIFTDNPTIQKLNRKYRGINKATDVLSFNYGQEMQSNQGSVPPFRSLGEIYLSLPYLRAAAKKMGISLNSLITQNVLHGILHLAGYNHKKKGERKIMQALEKKILDKLAP